MSERQIIGPQCIIQDRSQIGNAIQQGPRTSISKKLKTLVILTRAVLKRKGLVDKRRMKQPRRKCWD